MSKRIKVFAADGFSKEGVEVFARAEIFDVTVSAKTTHEELLAAIPEYDALIVRSASKASADVIEAGKKLRLIARAGVGIDNVDVAKATEKGIIVMNAPGGNTISTAELSFAMLMNLARHIPQAYSAMQEGKWEKKAFQGAEIHGKTLGIIGLGRIGREVSKYALAFEMKTLGYDPFLSEERIEALGVIPSALETIYREADFITVHTPLTKETENLITLETMKTMKPTARLINCARGGIINETDLAIALKEGIIAGAALDVYLEEPPREYAFKSVPSCITTPHLGASTAEAQVSVAIETANAIVSYFVEHVPRNSLNFPSVEAHVYKEIKSFVALATKMGRFLAQVSRTPGKGGLKSAKVSYSGAIAEKQNKMVTIAALKGLLEGTGVESANFVNAPFIARERGIIVSEENNAHSDDYGELVTVTIETTAGVFEAEGTIFSDNSARIVKYNNYRMELRPEGVTVFIQHEDKPGFIGNVGTIMGAHNVNIAEVRLIRESKNAPVLTALTLDEDVSEAIVRELANANGAYSVQKVTF